MTKGLFLAIVFLLGVIGMFAVATLPGVESSTVGIFYFSLAAALAASSGIGMILIPVHVLNSKI